MDIKLTRGQKLGIALLLQQRITRDDILYIGKYCRVKAEKLSDKELIKANPIYLTQGQKAYRTWLLRNGRQE